MESTPVQMTANLKEVRWKDGIAEIYTTSFLPEPKGGAPRLPLKVNRTSPLAVQMDAETAAAMKPGIPVVFQGTLNFQIGQYGAVGRTLREQQMHTLSATMLEGTPLGTYTSSDCVITIGGKTYPTRWATE